MRETSIQCIARKFLVPRLAERFQSQINHVGLAQALIYSSSCQNGDHCQQS